MIDMSGVYTTPTLDGPNRQSPIASVQRTRSTLSGHSAGRLGTNTTPTNAGSTRSNFCVFRGRYDRQRTPAIRIATIPRGPNNQKRGPTSKKLQSRSKFSISIKIFNLARNFQSRRLDFPTKIGAAVGWLARKFHSRSKFSISLEISFFFFLFGPSGFL